MPASLAAPVLQVDANVIHQVDTRNPDNLHSMWTVFSKCADSVAEGRRLENLSWRLWMRESFCCEASERTLSPSATSISRDIRSSSRSPPSEDVPQLSASVDSVVDNETVEFTAESAPVKILRPRIQRLDSCASSRSRGKELRHITSNDLEKMVVSIVHTKEPLDAPLPDISSSFPLTTPNEEKAAIVPELERSGSTTTEESSSNSSQVDSLESPQETSPAEEIMSKHQTTVVHGFSPSQIPIPSIVRSPPKAPTSAIALEPAADQAPKAFYPRVKQQAKFSVGCASSGDGSYSDPAQSVDGRRQPAPQPKKMFDIGASSDEDGSLKIAMRLAKPTSHLNVPKQTTSFSNLVETRTFPSSAAVDDDQSETDYVDESAIDDDDDDSSDWEDSIEDSGKSSIEDKISFKRVDSSANLTTRRSLITLGLAQTDRAQRFSNIASQSTSAIPRTRTTLQAPSLVASPNDSDDAPLMMKRGARPPPMRSINEIPRSAAQPITTTTNGIHHYPAALSPRTTRRNMLSAELPESLRRNLVCERSQNNGMLKRRHTSQDVQNLKQYPEKVYPKKDDSEVNASSWDHYFHKEAFAGYHSQGW